MLEIVAGIDLQLICACVVIDSAPCISIAFVKLSVGIGARTQKQCQKEVSYLSHGRPLVAVADLMGILLTALGLA
jgi:hypothetical protein